MIMYLASDSSFLLSNIAFKTQSNTILRKSTKKNYRARFKICLFPRFNHEQKKREAK